MKDNSTSLSLLNRAKEHDEASWRKIVSLYDPLVRRWSRSWHIQEAEEDDMCQHVFTMAFSSIQNFNRQRTGSFRKYIYTIARNFLSEMILKKKRLGKTVDMTQFQHVKQDNQEHSVFYFRATELVKSYFSEREWKIVEEYIMHGRTAADVASELGVGESSVYVTKHRVVKTILAEFEDILDIKQAVFLGEQMGASSDRA